MQVLKIVTEEGGQMFASYDNNMIRRVQTNRKAKKQRIRKCDKVVPVVCWPRAKRSKVIPTRYFQ